MAWAKGSLSGWNSFVTKGGDNGIGWAIRTGSDGGRACWTLRGSGGTEDMQGPSENDSNWHHYAGTYDLNGSITNITAVTNADTSVTYTTNVLGGGIRTLYVDGVQKGQYTGQTAYTPAAGHVTLGTEDLSSGNSYGNNGYITGNIYDVRIYNYALTQAQIITAGNILPKRPVFGGGPVSVTTGPNGPQFVLTYTNATLLSSTNVGGPFTAVAGATSPYTNILNNATPDVFFKLSIP
jgi:hypothetical protein